MNLAGLLQAKKDYERSQSSIVATGKPFEGFNPNSGGQQQFIDLVPLDQLTDLSTRWFLLRGGIGSGKSMMGAAFACSRAMLDPTSRGLITANDYQQLKTSTLVALAEFCQKFNIPLEPWVDGDPDETASAIANRRSCKIFDAHVLVISGNKFTGATKKSKEGGRGLQIRWCWADEFLYADGSAFNTLNGRLGRGNGIIKGVGLITSSPNKNNPYNWGYDYFDDPARDEEKARLHTSIVLDTRENIKNLGEDYVQSLESAYTPELALIELRGQYASLTTGRVYRYFDRNKHLLMGRDAIDLGYNPSEDLHLSFDFNWNPATCVAAHKRGKELFFVNEWKLSNSDTFEMAEAVSSWILEHRQQGQIYIHGDASGAARSANSKLTNWQIIWNTLKEKGLKDQCHKRYGSSNPSILDSVLGVNNLLMTERIFICSDACPNLAKDLEQTIWKDDAGTTIDKSNPELTHLSDTFRYLVWDEFPYKKQQLSKGQSSQTQKPVAGLS